ncbi:hypothetical protein Tco_0857737 [Tanacetum coccineum]|uniref:Uncharacterized protein n=1 Tax=Tanacetum coccineum TaxID=301880 RepID=A0ABQ5B734_9ASTR
MVSSCSDNDEKELQRLREIKKEMKERCTKNLRFLKSIVEDIQPKWILNGHRRAFEALFREKFDSFKDTFSYNMDRLEKQLDKKELHECDSKTYFNVIKTQFEKFLYMQSSNCLDYETHSKVFSQYASRSTHWFKSDLICFLDAIEKDIDVRAHHEEALRNKQEKLKKEEAMKTRLMKKSCRNKKG